MDPGITPKAAGGAEGSVDTGKRQILSKGGLEDLWILGDSVERWGLAWEANGGTYRSDTETETASSAGLLLLCLPLPRQVAEKPVTTGRGLPHTATSSCFFTVPD